MSIRVKDIEQHLAKMAPQKLAESWDQVGLFFGGKEKEVKKIQVSLGISPEVIQEAIANQVDMIITHHPIWLKPPVFFTEDDSAGKMVVELIQNHISVLSAHTNLDSCQNGINDVLANLLELQQIKPLQEIREEWFKLVVFVPFSHVEKVCLALGEAGAGKIGNYSHCNFRMQGQGTFLPLEGADPTIGKSGVLEQVEEERIEVIVNSGTLKNVLDQMKEAHPYEEVAYDLYSLKNQISSSIGLGRIGILSSPVSLRNLAKKIKEKLELPGLRYCGNPDQEIRTIALCGGAGMSLFSIVKGIKADVFLTGDIKHHEAEEAMREKIALIDGGHFGTEKVILPKLVSYLQELGQIEVYQSKEEDEIFRFE